MDKNYKYYKNVLDEIDNLIYQIDAKCDTYIEEINNDLVDMSGELYYDASCGRMIDDFQEEVDELRQKFNSLNVYLNNKRCILKKRRENIENKMKSLK